jgi:chromosome segregation ATPase
MAKKAATKKAEVVEQQAAVAAVSGLKVHGVVQEIGSLQVSVQETLANLSSTITGKLAQVEQIDLAIATKNSQLQELYGIEGEAAKLEDIKAQREQAEIDFQNEQEERQLRREEEQEEIAKQRQRDEEEHTYSVTRRNQRADQDYAALVDQHKRAEAVRQEELQRGWAQRDAALKAEEAAVAELKKQVESFDARVKAEVDKNVAIVSAQMKKAHEQEMTLTRKDIETAEKLHASEVKSLQATIASLSDQIEALQEQLAAARQDAKSVIEKTLEAQSKGEAFNALKQAMETTSQGGKGK